MKRSSLLIVVLVASVLGWLFVGWRVAALATGHLGPVTVSWDRFDRGTKYFRPGADFPAAVLDARHAIHLRPGQSVTILIQPPPHFSRGKIKVTSASPIAVSATAKGSGPSKALNDPRAPWSWSDLTKQGSYYPVTMTAPTGVSATVSSIKLTVLP